MAFLLGSCAKRDDETSTKTEWEWMAESPSGKYTPIFNSEDEVKKYIENNNKDFGTGTIIHRK